VARARSKVRTAKASLSDEGSTTEAAATEDDSAKSAPPSAPSEPTADEQK